MNVEGKVLTLITEGDSDLQKDDLQRALRVGEGNDSSSTKFAGNLYHMSTVWVDYRMVMVSQNFSEFLAGTTLWRRYQVPPNVDV